jgi:hypothetical protein
MATNGIDRNRVKIKKMIYKQMLVIGFDSE